jgi:3-dehydroquinate synthase
MTTGVDDASANSVLVVQASGSYPVYFAPGILSRLSELVARHLPSRRVIMLADQEVLRLSQAGKLGELKWAGETLTFPSGEESKTREWWGRLTDAMLERRYGRDSGIIGLGGGVAGDLSGFVAATYMRGIPHLQVPTTLLAMLDASVGGKTGINTPVGKNLVGAFHPPVAVVADALVLATLPDRAYRAGLAEAVKHGLIADADYFTWMEQQTTALLARDPAALAYLVRRSVEIKAQVVAADERETGQRAVLNAGHTVAHALEQVFRYQLPHGEAVALGLLAECALAEQLGVARSGVRSRLAALLGELGLPTRLPQSADTASLLASMAGDKKNRQGATHFTLVTEIGRMHQVNGWSVPVMSTDIARALATIG